MAEHEQLTSLTTKVHSDYKNTIYHVKKEKTGATTGSEVAYPCRATKLCTMFYLSFRFVGRGPDQTLSVLSASLVSFDSL